MTPAVMVVTTLYANVEGHASIAGTREGCPSRSCSETRVDAIFASLVQSRGRVGRRSAAGTVSGERRYASSGDASFRMRSISFSDSSTIFAEPDAVRVSLGHGLSRSHMRRAIVRMNQALLRAKMPYRIAITVTPCSGVTISVRCGDSAWPLQRGMVLFRDPGLTLARVAAEALGGTS